MMPRPVLILLALGLTAGCSRSSRGPEAVYREFFEDLVKYTRQPYPSHQKAAFDLLSSASQERLRRQAEAVNSSLPEGVPPVEPFELLVARRTRLGTTITGVEVVSEGAGRVELAVRYDQGQDRVVLVREGDAWRVDLFGAASGGEQTQAPPSPDSA